jgi:hypothetical protein
VERHGTDGKFRFLHVSIHQQQQRNGCIHHHPRVCLRSIHWCADDADRKRGLVLSFQQRDDAGEQYAVPDGEHDNICQRHKLRENNRCCV